MKQIFGKVWGGQVEILKDRKPRGCLQTLDFQPWLHRLSWEDFKTPDATWAPCPGPYMIFVDLIL